MSVRRLRGRWLSLAALLWLHPGQPLAAEPAPTGWQVEKCRIYAGALEALSSRGEPPSAAFLEDNRLFIAEGCLEPMPVCPRTDADGRLADLLTIVMVDAGAAGSFLPFGCG